MFLFILWEIQDFGKCVLFGSDYVLVVSLLFFGEILVESEVKIKGSKVQVWKEKQVFDDKGIIIVIVVVIVGI